MRPFLTLDNFNGMWYTVNGKVEGPSMKVTFIVEQGEALSVPIFAGIRGSEDAMAALQGLVTLLGGTFKVAGPSMLQFSLNGKAITAVVKA